MVNAFRRVGHEVDDADALREHPGDVGGGDESPTDGKLSTDAPSSSLDNLCAPPSLLIGSSEADGLWYKGCSLGVDAALQKYVGRASGGDASAAVARDTNLGILGVDGDDSFSIRRRGKARVMSDEARSTREQVRNNASSR